MFNKHIRRISIGLLCALIALVLIVGVQFPATATPSLYVTPGPQGIVSLEVYTFACAHFQFRGMGVQAAGGYAAVQIWANGTPIVDSYVGGHPSSYTPINSNGYFIETVSFPLQPNGTTLLARVYRALNPTPGSYDNQHYIDTTITCTYGIDSAWISPVYCDHFRVDGTATLKNGYAAVRVWLNAAYGTPLVDSYISGNPSVFMSIFDTGYGWGGYSGNVYYPAQPVGTTLAIRIYRALSSTSGSWDGGRVMNIVQPCTVETIPTVTPHP